MTKIAIHGGVIAGKRSIVEHLKKNGILEIQSTKRTDCFEYLLDYYFARVRDSERSTDVEIRVNAGTVTDYQKLLEEILNDVDGILFVFNIQKAAGPDLNGRSQWEKLKERLKSYKEKTGKNVSTVLCYNFYDFYEAGKECFDPEEMNKEINTTGLPHFATSGKTGKNIKEAFFKLLDMMKEARA
jgi:hypothetical protein